MSSNLNPIKEERHDEAEIRELAAKLLEANRNKVASAMARQAPSQHLNVVNLMPKKVDKRITQHGGTEDRKTDEDALRGRFGWMQLGKCDIPYIFRTDVKYCAVRMVEMKLLNKYLNHLHQDIYSCTCIRSYYITEAESRLLNEINIKHCDHLFGRDLFTPRDLIVRVTDAYEFYNFLDVCYSKLIQGSCNPKDRCGFIRINKESVVPYTVKNDNKYVPLFYFEGETENLKLKADQLEGWDLSYLKFCCKVQGIRNELFAHDSCAVISLNAIKSYFPPGTGFEDYWPSKVVESQLLLNGKNCNQVGQWTRQPPTPPIPPKTTSSVTTPSTKSNHSTIHNMQHTLQAQSHSNQTHMPSQTSPSVQSLFANYAGLVGGQQAYQTVSNATQQNQVVRMAQSPARASYQGPSPSSPRPGQRHQYYPALSQGPPPPPLIRSSVPQVTRDTSNYSTPPSLTPASQLMIQDINGMPTQVSSYSSTTRANVNMSQRYPPPLIPVRTLNGSQTPRYPFPPTNTTDAVDLSASHISRSQIRTNVTNDEQNHINVTNGRTTTVELGKKLTPISDASVSGNHIPYKFQKAFVEGKMIPCINMKPYAWTELLITLPDIVKNFFNGVSIANCRRVLDVLGIELYRANRQQLQILEESGKYESVNENWPLVQVHDVIKYMPQMKYMLGNLLTEPMTKRQRTS